MAGQAKEIDDAKWAKAVKDRDGCRCVECGSDNRLHAHHILPKSLGGKYTLENGTTLCLKMVASTKY